MNVVTVPRANGCGLKCVLQLFPAGTGKAEEGFMTFSIETGVPVLTVFLQGLLSFFSPCVLPLVPLYIGYLSGGAKVVEEDGTIRYPRGKILLHTVCFVIGISFAFFALGFGFSALGQFFSGNRTMFARISGILMILFGIYQTGILGHLKAVDREHRIHFRLDRFTMNPLVALVFGFTFSFAWTPCVGPALTSVLLMAGSAESGAKGFLLIGVYTLGFILPFLAAGIFTAGLLAWFKKHMKVVRYTVKAGGVLMILMGVLMFTGKMNDITGYLSSVSQDQAQTDDGSTDDSSTDDSSGNDSGESGEDGDGGSGSNAGGDANGSEDGQEDSDSSQNEEDSAQTAPAYAFELTDQFGNTHRLEDYKGKVIFLNFWATWCGPCRNEMPEIQKLYEEYAAQGENAEVAVIGVAGPGMGGEGSKEEITAFMEENGYTYPVLMDETGEMFNYYGISAFPTTFMIDREGNVYGYVSGQLTEDIMRSIIDQTLEGGA